MWCAEGEGRGENIEDKTEGVKRWWEESSPGLFWYWASGKNAAQAWPSCHRNMLGVGKGRKTVLLNCFKINLRYVCRTKCLSSRHIWCFVRGWRVAVWVRAVYVDPHLNKAWGNSYCVSHVWASVLLGGLSQVSNFRAGKLLAVGGV